MARFRKIPQIHEGRIVYGDGIVEGIVLLAVNEIPFVQLDSKDSGAVHNGAIRVRKDKDGTNVDVTVKIHYSQSVSETAFKIQEAIRHNVEAMTEYHVASVNVNISGVTFDDKNEKEEKTEEQNDNSLKNTREG